jgi:phage repressor protein C with HTH and peptisase S24 domain
LGVPLAQLLDEGPDVPTIREASPVAPPAASQGADMPVFAAQQVATDQIRFDAAPIDRMSRPAVLGTSPRAFAFYMSGESMAPAYEQGDVVLVVPGPPVTRGCDVVFTSVDGVSTVKRLISWTDKVWRVRQYAPSRETELPRASWPDAALIVGRFNRR